jgi:hypothetical protein
MAGRSQQHEAEEAALGPRLRRERRSIREYSQHASVTGTDPDEANVRKPFNRILDAAASIPRSAPDATRSWQVLPPHRWAMSSRRQLPARHN